MTQHPLYGPYNPHPLSQMRTELVWEGKYDEYGQRWEVDIAGCAMPMQQIEGIDEPRREAAANQQLTLFRRYLWLRSLNYCRGGGLERLCQSW